jgi:subtilisin family serine protease
MVGDPEIAWVEPDLNVGVIDALLNTTLGVLNLTTNTLFGLLQTKQVTPWAITAIEAHRSWARSGNGSGRVDVDVYIFDTGANHTDLNVTECIDFTQGDVRQCGLISNLDLDAHGTAVSGAAAASDNGKGVVGVVPGARVHALKVLGDDGSAPFSRVIFAIEYLTKRKIANPSMPMVANVSLGADIRTKYQSSLDRAVSASIASGITYVVAAGNEGIDASTVTPAHVPEAITVGAFNKKDRFSSFSNYGSVIDILAPGEDVESLTSGNAVNFTSGTSIASPYVTGAAALMLARHPNMSPSAVRNAVVAKASSGVSGVPRGTTDKRLNVRYLP